MPTMCQTFSSREQKERLLPSGSLQSSGEHTHTHTCTNMELYTWVSVRKENTRALGENNKGRGTHLAV